MSIRLKKKLHKNVFKNCIYIYFFICQGSYTFGIEFQFLKCMLKFLTNTVNDKGSEQHFYMRGFSLGWVRKGIDPPVVSSGLFTYNKSMLRSAVGSSDLILLRTCGVTRITSIFKCSALQINEAF